MNTAHTKAAQATTKREPSQFLEAPISPAKIETEDAIFADQLRAQWRKLIVGEMDQLIFGAMLQNLRDRITMCTRSHGDRFKHKGEGLKGWLEQHAPEISRRKAYHVLEIVDGIAAEFRLGKKVTLHDLLTTPLAELPAALAKKRAEIVQCVEGQSQRQLLLTFGKETARHSNGGDNHPDCPQCGANVRKSWTACPKCGGPLSGQPEDTEAARTKNAQSIFQHLTRSLFAACSEKESELLLLLPLTTDEPAKEASLTHYKEQLSAALDLVEKAIATKRGGAGKNARR